MLPCRHARVDGGSSNGDGDVGRCHFEHTCDVPRCVQCITKACYMRWCVLPSASFPINPGDGPQIHVRSVLMNSKSRCSK